VCGCSQYDPCEDDDGGGACCWADGDLCSFCASDLPRCGAMASGPGELLCCDLHAGHAGHHLDDDANAYWPPEGE
jgi:hypothetical protein